MWRADLALPALALPDLAEPSLALPDLTSLCLPSLCLTSLCLPSLCPTSTHHFATVRLPYVERVRLPRCRFADFHMGRTQFRELRPFYVKDATRETCMCIYHLRWAEFSSSLLTYRNQLRKEKVSSCNCNFCGLNEKGLRKQLVCERAEGASHDREACVTNQCPDCKDAARLTCGPGSLCDDELRDPGGEGRALQVHYEKYQKQTYYTKDGTAKDKKEFIKVRTAYARCEAWEAGVEGAFPEPQSASHR